jgi:hypothetical protein
MTDYTTDVLRLLSILLSAVAAGFGSVVWWNPSTSAICRPYDKRIVGDWLHCHLGKVLSFGAFNLAGKDI